MDLTKLQSHVDGRFEAVAQQMDSRFNKLESKLDDYAIQTVKNTSDLTWLKQSGSILLTILVLPGVGYLILQIIQSLSH